MNLTLSKPLDLDASLQEIKGRKYIKQQHEDATIKIQNVETTGHVTSFSNTGTPAARGERGHVKRNSKDAVSCNGWSLFRSHFRPQFEQEI